VARINIAGPRSLFFSYFAQYVLTFHKTEGDCPGYIYPGTNSRKILQELRTTTKTAHTDNATSHTQLAHTTGWDVQNMGV